MITKHTRQLSQLKKKFLEYYSRLPIQKLGAEFIEKDEDTITNWKKSDKDFSDALGRAKSEWVLKKISKAKPQWLLERIISEEFGRSSKSGSNNNPELEEWIVHIRKTLKPTESI